MKHIVDDLYDAMGEDFSVFTHLKITIHTFFCANCAREAKKLSMAEEAMKESFPSVSPDFEQIIMKRIDSLPAESDSVSSGDAPFRGWIITGLVVLVSLSTSFFGMDFEKVAHRQGSSFLIPVGITIGVVVTGYGALFIASHLKELSERFGLR